MSSVELLLLKAQVVDYAQSDDEFEQVIGRFLNERTDDLEGDDFVDAIRETIQGLEEAANRFILEWEVNL